MFIGRNRRTSDLVLGGALTLEESLAVLIHLDLGDHNLRRTNRDLGGLAVALVPGHPFNVNHPLLAEHTGDLSLTGGRVAANDLDLVILTDRQRADGVASLQLFRQRSGHDDASLMGRSVEVRLAARAPAAGDSIGELHFVESVYSSLA